MKLISWNVNGLRACINKGFLDFFKEIDADVFCLQEIKLQEGQIELDLPGYEQYWNYAERRATQALPCSPSTNPYRSVMVWIRKNTIRKGA